MTTVKTVMKERRWVEKYPELGTGPVSAEPCISPEYFELEREKIFRRSWLNVGNVCEIPERGDYFVRELTVCNASILVMRGQDGVVRGFHNVCSHRGNTLAWDEKGKCRGYLTCNFHSWGYDSTGQLKWVPDEANFFDLDKSQLGLTPVATEVFNGFIFINLDPSPRENLTSYLDGLDKQLTGGDFGKLKLARRYRIDEKANWKIGLDAQNEVYHLPFQHRYIMPDLFLANERGMVRVMDVSFFNRHSVYSCEMNPGHKPSALESFIMSMETSEANRCRLPVAKNSQFDFYLIFPNFVLIFFRSPSKDICVTYNFWPLAVDHTIWEIRLYAAPMQSAADRLVEEFTSTRNRLVFDEDAVAHETVHTGLKSRAKKQLFFQDEEIQIRHFHKVVEDHVGPFTGA
jgi:phenylpropionate dioxygenase-like ring-hydroxylating dioxygenase large terminal subunit